MDRVASTFPKIRSGVCESADDRYVTNISELTPLPGPKLGETESLQIGTEIARGLPRRFPATDAFVKLCWSSAIAQPLEGEPTMGNPWTKGKCLGLQVTRTRLESWFTAFVDMGDVSPLSIEPPCVSETVAEVIETIGGKFWSETSFVPTNNELNGIKERERIARELSKKYRLLANRDDSPVAIAECLRNEQDIQADTVRSLTDPDLASSRVKNYKIEFSRTLRPLGYRYDPGESQPRYHVAKRSSPSGNTIAIVSDVGGHGPPWEPSFNMVVRGLGWRIAVPISRSIRFSATKIGQK